MNNKGTLPLWTALAFLTIAHHASAQVLLRDELTSGDGWSLLHEYIDPTFNEDNFATFGYDYSTLGIPEAPNSQPGDASTAGLQIIANRDLNVVNSLAVFPTDMTFTGRYKFQFDLWMNAAGPFPDGAVGSTEHGGGAVGFDNAATFPLSGASLIVSGEGWDTPDYRLYAHEELQLFTTHIDPDININDLYAPELTSANSEDDTYLQGIFPGQSPPAAQTSACASCASAQIGTVKDGTLGFRWATFTFTVDTEAGTAQVQITDADTQQTADIGTFTLDNTYVDRDTIDTKLITTLEGNVAMIYRDRFESIINPADLADLSFGLYDNVLVEQIADTGLGGDYNEDGVVNAADYVVWRNNAGTSFDLPNRDPDASGDVGPDDYQYWVEKFGDSAGSGAGSAKVAAVPEPGSLMLLCFVGCVVCVYQRSYRRVVADSGSQEPLIDLL